MWSRHKELLMELTIAFATIKSFSGFNRQILIKQQTGLAGYEIEIQSVVKIEFYCGVAIRSHLASELARLRL